MPVIILPTLIGMYFVTNKYDDVSRQLVRKNTETVLYTIVEKIDQKFERFEEISLKFFVNQEIDQLLQIKPQTYFERLEIHQQIEGEVNALLEGQERQYVSSIILLSPSGDQKYVIGNKVEYPEQLYNDVINSNGEVFWEYNLESTDETDNLFFLGREINGTEDFNRIGTIIFAINTDAFLDIINEFNISEGTILFLMAKNDTILGDDNLSENQKQSSLKITIDSEFYDWLLTAYVPLKHLESTKELTKYFTFLVVMICIIIGFVMTRLITTDIIIPINKLKQNMSDGLKGKNPNELIRFKGSREIAELNNLYIYVMHQINDLTEELIINEKKKQKAEVQILQDQLSPHFLYNTLNSIRWMAIIQKQDNIKKMVDSLNNLLSYSLRSLGEPVSLKEELGILEDYVSIQQIRYQNFNFETDVPDELQDVKVLKFLHQPLIENALIHGIAQMDGIGRITLKAYEDKSQLIVQVSDNGVGIPAQKLRSIQQKLDREKDDRIGNGEHIGISNIHERIQLHYGRQYGVKIIANRDSGVTVRLILPLVY